MTEGTHPQRGGERPSHARSFAAAVIDGVVFIAALAAINVFLSLNLDFVGELNGEAAAATCVSIGLGLVVYLLVTLREPRDLATLGQKAMSLEMLPVGATSPSPWRWWFVARLPLLLLLAHLAAHTTIFIHALSQDNQRPAVLAARPVAFRLGVAMLVAQVLLWLAKRALSLRGASAAERFGRLRERAVSRATLNTADGIPRGVGFAPRFAATSVDLLIIVVFSIGAEIGMDQIRNAFDYPWRAYFRYLEFIVPGFLLLYTLMDAWGGRTLGKRLLGLRIASRRAEFLPRSTLLLRWLMRRPAELCIVLLIVLPTYRLSRAVLGEFLQWAIPIAVLACIGFEFVSGLACLFGKGRRALHDMICGTNVFYADQVGRFEGGRFEPILHAGAVAAEPVVAIAAADAVPPAGDRE